MTFKKHILFLAALCLCSQLLGAESRKVVSLSDDQKRVGARLGWPATFLLMDGRYDTEQGEGRVEVWFYPNVKKSFSFKDGRFMGETSMPAPPEKISPNPLRPTWFSKKLNKEDVIARLGEPSGDKKAQINDEDFGQIEALFFPKYNARVCFKDGHLLLIETRLLKKS